MKAMILAAGLGTRLRPLTYVFPKPLLKVGGRPLIAYNLRLLKKSGIKEAVINLHHLGNQIKEYVGSGKKFGIKIRYSNEKKILGTGGGLKKAENFLKKGPFVVLNADVLAEIKLKDVIKHHLKSGAAATMVIRKLKPKEDYTRLSVKNGYLKNFGTGKYHFTGIQILNPSIFNFLRIPSCLIESGYKKLLKKKIPISVYIQKGYWNDIGTLDRLKKARAPKS